MRPFGHLSLLLSGVLLASVSLALAPVPALGVGTLDQSQQVSQGGGVFSSGTWAQTFTAGVSGTLDRVSVAVGSPVSFGEEPADEFTVEMFNTVAGVPGTEMLASENVAIGLLPDEGYGWFDIDFASPASVVAGTVYAIVLPATTSGTVVFGYQFPGEYLHGDLYQLYWDGWSTPRRDDGSRVVIDLMFRTYVTAVPTYAAAQPLGAWRSNHAATNAQLPVELGTYMVDTVARAKAVFDASNCGLKKADALGCLAGQLLTAELNYLNGSDVCIADAIVDADALLGSASYGGPGSYRLSRAQRASALTLKNVLSTYNTGLGCPV